MDRIEHFDDLSPTERILAVQDLWDRIAAEPDAVPVRESQRAELDRRLADHEAAPDTSVPWESIKRHSFSCRVASPRVPKKPELSVSTSSRAAQRGTFWR